MYVVREELKRFCTEEDGLGTVEIILIIVVIIGLIVIFRNRLKTLITNIFDTIDTDAGNV